MKEREEKKGKKPESVFYFVEVQKKERRGGGKAGQGCHVPTIMNISLFLLKAFTVCFVLFLLLLLFFLPFRTSLF
jgi:hypothetical protein